MACSDSFDLWTYQDDSRFMNQNISFMNRGPYLRNIARDRFLLKSSWRLVSDLDGGGFKSVLALGKRFVSRLSFILWTMSTLHLKETFRIWQSMSYNTLNFTEGSVCLSKIFQAEFKRSADLSTWNFRMLNDILHVSEKLRDI